MEMIIKLKPQQKTPPGPFCFIVQRPHGSATLEIMIGFITPTWTSGWVDRRLRVISISVMQDHGMTGYCVQ